MQVLGPQPVSQLISAFGDLRALLAWRSPNGVHLQLFDADGSVLAQPVTPNLPRYSEPRHIVLLPQRFVVFVDTFSGCANVARCRAQTYVFSVGLNAEVSVLAQLALDGQRVLLTLAGPNEHLVLITDGAQWIDLELGGSAGFAAVGHKLELMPYVAPVTGAGEPLLVTADWRGQLSIIGASKRWDVPGPQTFGAVGASASTRLFAEYDAQGRVHLMWTAPPYDGRRQVSYGWLEGDSFSTSIEQNVDAPVHPPFDKYVFANCCAGDEFTRRSWPDEAVRGAQPVSWDPRFPAPLQMAWNGRSYVLLHQGEQGQLVQTSFDCR
jgi:hypothetical protein